MAIFLPPIYRDGLPFRNAFYLLFHLASALLERSRAFKRPEGIKQSIEYLRFLRGSSFDSFDVPRSVVMTLLVQGLGIQVEAGDGDRTQSIKEMLTLCRELPTLSESASLFSVAFRSLSEAADAEFRRGLPIESLDEVVECLRDAVKVCPTGSFPVLLALALPLFNRFIKTHSLDDYEEATALLENILDPNRSRGCPDSIRNSASQLATMLVCSRFAFYKKAEYLEVAISRLRAGLSSPSIDEVTRFQFSELLSMLVKERFTDYSLSESLEEANSNSARVVSLLPSQTMEKSGVLFIRDENMKKAYSIMELQQKIQCLEELLSDTSPGTDRHKDCLSQLAHWYQSKFRRTNDTSDINESIKYSRLSINATHANDPWRVNSLSQLHFILLLGFEKSGKISYLDESIIIGYDILKLGNHQDFHFRAVQNLVSSLLSRGGLLGRIEDFHEAIRLMPLVVNDQDAGELDRFKLSCWWAILARRIGHPTGMLPGGRREGWRANVAGQHECSREAY